MRKSISEKQIRYCYETLGLNQIKTGLRLGISDGTVYRLMKKYGIKTRPSVAHRSEWK